MRKYILSVVLTWLSFTILPAKEFVVVLDAGHGGHDPGAVGSYMQEKFINLDIVKQVGAMIESNCPAVKVLYTRTTDVFIQLNDRAKLANKNKADLFISIHTNASKSKAAFGTETYILGLNKTAQNLELSKRENSVILLEQGYQEKYEGFDPNSPESYIIFEFMQNTYMEQSIELAAAVQEQFSNLYNRNDRGVRQAPFLVLHATTMPSILVEVGYISNKSEEAYLASEKGRAEISTAIFKAFTEYKREYDRKNGINTPLLTTKERSKNTTEEPSTSSPNAISLEESSANINNADNELVFKIQIFSTKDRLKKGSSNFKGYTNISYFQENGLYKYTIGEASSPDQITALRQQINKSFPGNFIIAFHKGSKKSYSEALKIYNSKNK